MVPEDIELAIEPRARVRATRGREGRCWTLVAREPGTVTLTLDATIDGDRSQARHSFEIVEARLRGDWAGASGPALEGEVVTARVWAETADGTLVLTDAQMLSQTARP